METKKINEMTGQELFEEFKELPELDRCEFGTKIAESIIARMGENFPIDSLLDAGKDVELNALDDNTNLLESFSFILKAIRNYTESESLIEKWTDALQTAVTSYAYVSKYFDEMRVILNIPEQLTNGIFYGDSERGEAENEGKNTEADIRINKAEAALQILDVTDRTVFDGDPGYKLFISHDSKMSPTIPRGSSIISIPVDTTKYIAWNEMYVMEDIQDSVLIGRLNPSDKEDQYFIKYDNSESAAPEYIPKSSIKSVYRVISVITGY